MNQTSYDGTNYLGLSEINLNKLKKEYLSTIIEKIICLSLNFFDKIQINPDVFLCR